MRTWIVVAALIAPAGCVSSQTDPAPRTDSVATSESRATASASAQAAKPVPAAASPAQDERPPETLFAVRFLPGPKWVAGKGPMAQPGIMAHAENMESLHERHVLWCGGPFLDSSGGLAVLRVASLDEAKKIAADDPGVKSGLFVPEVHAWLLVEAAEK